jgi:hypothetical protein
MRESKGGSDLRRCRPDNQLMNQTTSSNAVLVNRTNCSAVKLTASVNLIMVSPMARANAGRPESAFERNLLAVTRQLSAAQLFSFPRHEVGTPGRFSPHKTVVVFTRQFFVS